MAPPAPMTVRPPEKTAVLMTTFRSKDPPAAEMYPMAPLYTPLASRSSWSMICIVLILGAPVMEPAGKAHLMHSTAVTPSSLRPLTVETIWCTVAYVSMSISFGTWTEPILETRPMSFLSRSTIIRFSALSLPEPRSDRRASASASLVAPLLTVPLMGLASRTPSWVSFRNRSGLLQHTATPSRPDPEKSRNAE